MFNFCDFFSLLFFFFYFMDFDISTHKTHLWELIRCLVGSHDLWSEYVDCVIFLPKKRKTTNNNNNNKSGDVSPGNFYSPFTIKKTALRQNKYCSVGKCINIYKLYKIMQKKKSRKKKTKFKQKYTHRRRRRRKKRSWKFEIKLVGNI